MLGSRLSAISFGVNKLEVFRPQSPPAPSPGPHVVFALNKSARDRNKVN